MDTPTPEKGSWIKDFLKELGKLALLIIFVVIPFRFWVAQPFLVSGESMIPTFENSDYLIVDQISHRIKDFKRFDVIVFKPPFSSATFFIKRIIGLPGETVKINNGVVTIIKTDGQIETLTEDYVMYEKNDVIMSKKLAPDEYFVMGDNRAGSYDSRSWGPLKEDRIVGKPILRLVPLGNFGLWPGKK